jgi:diaminobutyrate-2-oxoglutarate transaminase
MQIFESHESNVRSYCRSFPVVFSTSQGSHITDESGERYIDFFCGAGSLNYGHNHPVLKKALMAYIAKDGLVHGLDMATEAKAALLRAFDETVLQPNGLDYKVQFTGPTGTNAVEAALKLARKVTARHTIVAFTNGYHGLTQGALAVTANAAYRHSDFTYRHDSVFLPYDGYMGFDTADYFEKLVTDRSSGLDLPAAVILETVQGEGGINIASDDWLRRIRAICDTHGILMIVDDIQMGCGRTGSYFSFTEAGIVPDIVVLSKSLSGYGLPMSVLLMKRELDQWAAGEHTGTFRGHNLAFVTATECLKFWADPGFVTGVREKSDYIAEKVIQILGRVSLPIVFRHKGMAFGLETDSGATATAISQAAFASGLIVETCGAEGHVLKLFPALTVSRETLDDGLAILETAMHAVANGETDALENANDKLVVGS